MMRTLLRGLVWPLLLSGVALAGGLASVRAEVGPTSFSIRGYIEENLISIGNLSVQSGVHFEVENLEYAIEPYFSMRWVDETWSLTIGYYPTEMTIFVAGVYQWR